MQMIELLFRQNAWDFMWNLGDSAASPDERVSERFEWKKKQELFYQLLFFSPIEVTLLKELAKLNQFQVLQLVSQSSWFS